MFSKEINYLKKNLNINENIINRKLIKIKEDEH